MRVDKVRLILQNYIICPHPNQLYIMPPMGFCICMAKLSCENKVYLHTSSPFIADHLNNTLICFILYFLCNCKLYVHV